MVKYKVEDMFKAVEVQIKCLKRLLNLTDEEIYLTFKRTGTYSGKWEIVIERSKDNG